MNITQQPDNKHKAYKMSDITLTIQTRIHITHLAAIHKHLVTNSVYPPNKSKLLSLAIDKYIADYGIVLPSIREAFVYLEERGIHTGSRPMNKATLLAIEHDSDATSPVDSALVESIAAKISKHKET